MARRARPVDPRSRVPGGVTAAIDRHVDARLALLGRPADGGAGLVVRPADGNDPALARLAEHDRAPVPRAPVLVAEREGRPVAAIGVVDRRVLADPRRPDHHAIDRLQAIAAERRGAARRRGWAARLR